MFIGHFALALGAKRAAPQLSLGTLVAACQLADLVWPVLVLLGMESFEIHPGITAVTPLDFTRYPYSHSLVALALWALAFAGPPPPSTKAVAWSAMAIWVLVAWAWWLDAHRESRVPGR